MREALFGFRLNASPSDRVVLHTASGAVEGNSADHTEAYGIPATMTPGGEIFVTHRGRTHTFSVRGNETAGHASAHDGDILAPMPGKVIAVDVAEGDTVTAGQRLMVLEAMKMEHALTAPFDGTVTELNASEGGQVQVEAVLCVVEPAEE